METNKGRKTKDLVAPEAISEKAQDLVKQEDASIGIEASKVELGYDAGMGFADNIGKWLADVVRPKYPKYYITYVNRESVRQGFKGWKPLKVNFHKGTVEECDIDEAEKTTGNVLAWRDMRIQKKIRDDRMKLQKQRDQITQTDGTERQAEAFNAQVASLSGGMIRAKPLGFGD